MHFHITLSIKYIPYVGLFEEFVTNSATGIFVKLFKASQQIIISCTEFFFPCLINKIFEYTDIKATLCNSFSLFLAKNT